MTSDDKVGGWVKKVQNHDDVILEWSQRGNKSPNRKGEIKVQIKIGKSKLE
jgi:hypothetical protein